MEEKTNRSEFSKRLRKLPGQLLLALVNATALLVIAAAVMAIAALNYVNNAAAELAETVTDTVIEEIDIEPERLVNGLRELDSEIGELRIALAEGRAEWPRQIEARIESLTLALTNLNTTLTNASSQLTEQAIRQAGDSITDGLLRLRRCQVVPTARDGEPAASRVTPAG